MQEEALIGTTSDRHGVVDFLRHVLRHIAGKVIEGKMIEGKGLVI